MYTRVNMSVSEGDAEFEPSPVPNGSADAVVPDDYMAEIIEAQRMDARNWAAAISNQFSRLGVTDDTRAYFRTPIAESGTYFLMITRPAVQAPRVYDGSLLRVIFNHQDRDIVDRRRTIASHEYFGIFDSGSCDISQGHFSFSGEKVFDEADIPLTMPPIIWPDKSGKMSLYRNPSRAPLTIPAKPPSGFEEYYKFCRYSEMIFEKLRFFDESDIIRA
jgi:hypothetical protein